jgi:hypothetical protein
MNVRLITILGLTVVLLWLTTWGLLCWFIPNAPERGHFGDQFGSINALFSGFAFAAIFASLLAQHIESKKQEARFNQQLSEARTHAGKQIELAALTSYANLTLALFLNNEKHADAAKQRGSFEEENRWRPNAGLRYNEMIKAKEVFEKLLKEAHFLE